jgi:hypothetical protein
MPLDLDDAFIAGALARAAERVGPEPTDKSFLERRLVEAVAASLADGYFHPDAVVRDKKLAGCLLPGWDPQPGTIDLAVITPQSEPRIVFEMKIDDVEWTLWDIYKMVAASELPTVEAAYLVVAGRPKLWNGRRECVELFDLDYTQRNGQVDEVEWTSRFLFRHYRKSWQELLQGGSGRLTSVPEVITITGICCWPLPAYPDYEMRVIRLCAAPRREPWLQFANEWPLAPEPVRAPATDQELQSIPTSLLEAGDLPSPKAEEQAYHLFALTYNGYEEMGSMRRCARIANEAIERWRETGQLPDGIDRLRACLFFEQRRWHHYGDGFDEETMSYVKEIITRIRRQLEGEAAAG